MPISQKLKYITAATVGAVKNDEFDDGSLDSTWTVSTTSGGAVVEDTSHLNLTCGAGTLGSAGSTIFEFNGVYAPYAAGDLDFYVRMTHPSTAAGLRIGLVVGSAFSSASHAIYVAGQSAWNYRSMLSGGYQSGGITSTSASTNQYLRISRIGSTFLFYDSSNGTTWELGRTLGIYYSTEAGNVGLFYMCTGTATAADVKVEFIRELPLSSITSITINPTTAGMTRKLPVCVKNNPVIDDSFSDAALDTTVWTKSTTLGGVSETTALLLQCATNSTTNYNFAFMESPYNGVRQTLDAGDFDVVTKFSSASLGRGKRITYGFCVQPAAAATGEKHGIVYINAAVSTSTSLAASTLYKFHTTSTAAATFTAFTSVFAMPGVAPLYARINRTGTLLTFYASTNGTTWETNSTQSTCSTSSYFAIIGAITNTGTSQTASTTIVSQIYSYTTNLVTGYIRLEPESCVDAARKTRIRVYQNSSVWAVWSSL